jgi:hypothetical protein
MLDVQECPLSVCSYPTTRDSSDKRVECIEGYHANFTEETCNYGTLGFIAFSAGPIVLINFYALACFWYICKCALKCCKRKTETEEAIVNAGSGLPGTLLRG